MTTIAAKVIARSCNADDPTSILTTMQCRFPRWIHAEGRTHRLLSLSEDEFAGWEPRTPSFMEDRNLSRNASSSRAVPVKKLIQDILDDPAVPLFWGKNQRGMQAGEECDNFVTFQDNYGDRYHLFKEGAWMKALHNAVGVARAFDDAGYHKQIVNRLLEPFSHINVVVTATEWDNFFALRIHDAAEPHIRLLAERMRDAMYAVEPTPLKPGVGWHLPYVEGGDWHIAMEYGKGIDDLKALSVARCASVSFKTVDGLDMTTARALALEEKLRTSVPIHASPFEHQARPDEYWDDAGAWMNPDKHGNFKGWIQHRQMLDSTQA